MEENYNPIGCEHKKTNGLTAYELLSLSSGSGPDLMFQKNVFVCMLCGEIKVSGYELIDGKLHKYEDEFSIYFPKAVAAIVKNCNYMNSETDGFEPFEQKANP